MWVRVDLSAVDNELWDVLAERLAVPSAQALGHYMLMFLRLVRRRPDGRLADVPSSALETWANWRGAPGAWSDAVRACCQDEEGELRGFRKRNAKLIARQLADAARRRDRNPQETPSGHVRVPATNPPKTRGPTKTIDGHDDENEKSIIYHPAESDAISYSQACTAAANLGMRENPAIGTAFNELVSSSQAQVVADWMRAGVPVEVAVATIRQRAQEYRPTAHRRQPTNLRYFLSAVLESWERYQGRASEDAVRGVPALPNPPEPEDEFTALERKLSRAG